MKYPFSPELLDAIPEELAELFRGLELKLLEEICSRLKIADQLNEVTVQDIRALRSHDIDLEDIKKAIRETTEIGAEKLDKLLDDVVARNQRYYTEMVDLAGVMAPERLVSEADIAAICRQTWGAYKNIKSARCAFETALREKKLELKDGTLTGLDEFIKAQKEADPDAFAPDKAPPRFVTGSGSGGGHGEPPENVPENVRIAKEMGAARAASAGATNDVLKNYL